MKNGYEDGYFWPRISDEVKRHSHSTHRIIYYGQLVGQPSLRPQVLLWTVAFYLNINYANRCLAQRNGNKQGRLMKMISENNGGNWQPLRAVQDWQEFMKRFLSVSTWTELNSRYMRCEACTAASGCCEASPTGAKWAPATGAWAPPRIKQFMWAPRTTFDIQSIKRIDDRSNV